MYAVTYYAVDGHARTVIFNHYDGAIKCFDNRASAPKCCPVFMLNQAGEIVQHAS